MPVYSYVGSFDNLRDKTTHELLEMLSNPNLNQVSKNEINMALLEKLDEGE